jgi:rhodanese-related sulfurtransferase
MRGRGDGVIVWSAGACAALLAVACAGDASGSVSADELLRRIDAGAAPIVVDVRSEGEYRAAHVPGARHLPFQSIAWRADELAAPSEAEIVVYCEHGPRAGLAAFALSLRGYRHVRTLEGHLSGWKARSLPVVAGAQP